MRGSLLAFTLVTCFGSSCAMAQTPWQLPRLPNGQPDLQGTWENNSATPHERPRELARKPLIYDVEVAAM